MSEKLLIGIGIGMCALALLLPLLNELVDAICIERACRGPKKRGKSKQEDKEGTGK